MAVLSEHENVCVHGGGGGGVQKHPVFIGLPAVYRLGYFTNAQHHVWCLLVLP